MQTATLGPDHVRIRRTLLSLLLFATAFRRDPLTGRELRPDQIGPNLNLYSAIQEWIDSQSE